MKSKDVLGLLRITRQTLTKYVKDGKIKVNVMENGRYDYDEKSVNKLFYGDRNNVIYVRETGKEKKDSNIKTKVEAIKDYCVKKGIDVSKVYMDKGKDWEECVELKKLWKDILTGKVGLVVVYDNKEICGAEEEFVAHILWELGADLVVVND